MGLFHIAGFALPGRWQKWLYCPAAGRTSSRTSQATLLIRLCLSTSAKVRGGRKGQRTRGTLRLASHGEFFIGAGNVALVTVALLEVGTSAVLSNRAWPGAERKRVKGVSLACSPVVQGQRAQGSWSDLQPQNTFEVMAFCRVQWVRQLTCYC